MLLGNCLTPTRRARQPSPSGPRVGALVVCSDRPRRFRRWRCSLDEPARHRQIPYNSGWTRPLYDRRM